MDPQLDLATDRCVAQLARVCLAPTEVQAQQIAADSNLEVLAALRLVAGGVRMSGGRESVNLEKLRWLLEQVTLRLLRRVDDRLASSYELALDAAGKAALRAEFADAFAAIMGDIEASLAML